MLLKIPTLLVRLFATTALALLLAPCATAQLLQTWDTKARERSQRLHSAGVTALEKGQTDQAVALLNQAIAADANDHVAFNTLGLALARQEKYEEALAALQKAYKLSHEAETLLSTGMVYYLQRDYPAAIKSFNRALEIDTKLWQIHGALGFTYMRIGDFEKAEASFQRLIKAHPSSVLAYRGLALCKYLSGEITAATKSAEHAQTLSSSSKPILLLLAKLEFVQGNTDAGKLRVKEWQAATLKKKVAPFAMTIFGYPKQHDFHWDILLADNFDNGNFLLARTRLLPKEDGARRSYAAKGKLAAILPQCKAATEAAPDDFYLWHERALLELASGDYAQASEHFAKVLQLCPVCRIDWLHLARAQALAGKPDEAAYALNEFRRQLPNEKLSPIFTQLATQAKEESPPEKPATDSNKKPASTGGSGF